MCYKKCIIEILPGRVHPPGIFFCARRQRRRLFLRGAGSRGCILRQAQEQALPPANDRAARDVRRPTMLRPRQQRFVEEYLVDPNGHQAALRAGYAPKCARQTVTKLLKHPEIAAAIRRDMDARSQRMRLDADRVLAELARIAFADIGNLVDWGPDGVTLKPKRELSADDRAAVAEVVAGAGKNGAGPRLRLHSKQRALDAIARHFGLYGKTAHRFEPPRRDEGKSAREILMEKLAAMNVAREARAPDGAEKDE
jgi:phage terminase small subunit